MALISIKIIINIILIKDRGIKDKGDKKKFINEYIFIFVKIGVS